MTIGRHWPRNCSKSVRGPLRESMELPAEAHVDVCGACCLMVVLKLQEHSDIGSDPIFRLLTHDVTYLLIRFRIGT